MSLQIDESVSYWKVEDMEKTGLIQDDERNAAAADTDESENREDRYVFNTALYGANVLTHVDIKHCKLDTHLAKAC
jgi:hypothetical protein